jgi:hypothetical protein
MSDRSVHRPHAEPYVEDGRPPASWTAVVEELERSFTYWVATLHPAGRPHMVPVLGVVNDEALHFAAGPGSQKIRNLDRGPAISVATSGEEFDVVLEGTARRVEHRPSLAHVAAAYTDKYGWEVDVVDSALWGEGAPSAGPPPYHLYRLTPHRAFSFPTNGATPPTRWTF